MKLFQNIFRRDNEVLDIPIRIDEVISGEKGFLIKAIDNRRNLHEYFGKYLTELRRWSFHYYLESRSCLYERKINGAACHFEVQMALESLISNYSIQQ
jgi:hypothetical protein